MKKLRLAYWTLALMLCLVHIILLVAYTRLCLSTDNRISPSAMGYWVVISMSIVLLSVSVVVKSKRVTPWITTMRLVPLLVLAGLLGGYLIDSHPIDNDYSEKNLLVANSGGHTYLAPFYSKEKADAFQTTAMDQELKVMQAWTQISEFRTAIEGLDRFEAIRDLPENAVIDIKAPVLKFTIIKGVADVYRNFIQYQLRQGNGAEALRHLGQLHRVARKGMTGSVLVIHKIMFAALSNKTMSIAYEVLDSDHCHTDLVKILNDDFRPLKKLECDMERVFIGEYLIMKNLFSNGITADNFLDTFQLDNTINDERRKLTGFVYRPFSYLLYKPNMTIGFHRKYFDLLIEGEEQQPPDYEKALLFFEAYSRQPSFRNMIGWILNNVALPNFSNYGKKIHEKKVQSELLAWAIGIRLNEAVNVSGDVPRGQHHYSESKGQLRSMGPDGLYNTEDDITLEKPE